MNTARCNRFNEDIVGLLEGTADEALRGHVASCDECRDAKAEYQRGQRARARAAEGAP